MKTLSCFLRKIIVGIYLVLYKNLKTETSKWILRFCDFILVITLSVTFYGWLQGFDILAMSEIIKSLCALCATAHGFYFWKSKVENCRKYPDVMECILSGNTDILKDMNNHY